jgi:hypothetical protein
MVNKPRISTKRVPSHDELLRDLIKLRLNGLVKLRGLELPALARATLIAESTEAKGTSSGSVSTHSGSGATYLPQAIEELLRSSLDRMDGGPFADAAELLFGLGQGLRGVNPTELRARAADALSVKSETFRKENEKQVISELAEAILAICRDQDMRDARIAMMDTRHPADSRLAVNWAERFEDYYRIWTPIIAMAGDLTAYRSTLLEQDRPYDDPAEPGKLIAPMSTETEGYTQEYQAEGYIRFAIYRYGEVLQEMHRFKQKRGGFWLLSDQATETQVSDAVYRIGWHNPNNERDDSWMRVTMQQSQGELHTFQHILMTTGIGQATHTEWQEWAAECTCTWDQAKTPNERGAMFATHETDDGVNEDCQLHQVVAACLEYTELIDADWLKIADWYRIEEGAVRRRESGEGLYVGLRNSQQPF